MLAPIVIASALLYAGAMLIVAAGMRRSVRAPRRADNYEPTVSVIVAARNEQEHIADCVDSLLRLDYPREKLDLIVVNDASTDRTGEILSGYAAGNRLRVLGTARDSALRGKTNAVATGIRQSQGEIILLTDADCTVDPQWVRSTVRSFMPETGVVGGFTALHSDTLFHRVQALDWFFLFSLASGSAGWGMPLTVIGNNFAIRRSAYEETGGYEEIPFSVTEDYALVQAVLRRTNFAVSFPLESGALVESQPCRSAGHLFRQKQRWGVGGLDMVLRGMLVMGIGWCARLLALVALCGFSPASALIGGAIVLAADLLLLSLPLRRFSRGGLLRSILPFECYLTFYALLLPFVALASRRVIWKERRL